MQVDDSFYGGVARILDEELARVMPVETVPAVREACVDRIAGEFGGSQVYLPSRQAARLKERNARIRAAFNGVNYAELARQWALSERQVRQIVDGSRR